MAKIKLQTAHYNIFSNNSQKTFNFLKIGNFIKRFYQDIPTNIISSKKSDEKMLVMLRK